MPTNPPHYPPRQIPEAITIPARMYKLAQAGAIFVSVWAIFCPDCREFHFRTLEGCLPLHYDGSCSRTHKMIAGWSCIAYQMRGEEDARVK